METARELEKFDALLRMTRFSTKRKGCEKKETIQETLSQKGNMVDNDAVLEQIYEDLLEAGFEDCEETAELARLAFFMDSMEV